MNINKAQDQTILIIGVYLPQHIFSCRQLYVALFRGVSISSSKVLVKSNKKNKEKKTTRKM